MTNNRYNEQNSANYVNSWENVRAYVEFIFAKNQLLLRKFKDEFINPFDNIKFDEQEKIHKLREWVDDNLTTSTTFNIVKKFIENQLEQFEGAKLARFHLKNTYSAIAKDTRNNYLKSVTTFLNNTNMEVLEKTEALKTYFRRNNPNYTSYARFTKTIKYLGVSLFMDANESFKTVKKYSTEINWNSVQDTMALNFNTSMTDNKKALEKINKRIIKIIRGGASDNVKIDSLFNFLIDSLKEHKRYKRLSYTLTQILDTFFVKGKDDKYAFTNTFNLPREQPTLKRK